MTVWRGLMFECETCGGKGGEKWKWVGAEVQDGWACPDCDGKGYLIPDELRGRVASTIWELVPHNDREDVADAVLAAVFDWFGDAKTNMRVFGSLADMKEARRQLGNPAALNEAMVATGIDALFVLLEGGTVEIDGRVCRIVDHLLLPPRVES